MTDDELREYTDAVAEKIDAVRADMTSLVNAFRDHKEATDRKTSRFTAAIAVLIVLLIALGSVAVSNWRNSDRLERLTQIGVCPSNAFQLGSYDPNTRYVGRDRDIYEQTFTNLRAARYVLGCQDAPTPKPIQK